MKDKRNCNNNMNYPVYPQPMIPPMGYPNSQPFPNYNIGMMSNNVQEQQINNLEQQLNQLEQRVTRLERQYMNTNNSNNYNGSNYYMV